MREYNFGRVADLSTGHIRLSTRHLLENTRAGTNPFLKAVTGDGYLMRPILEHSENMHGLPVDLIAILDIAAMQGFEWVNFDCDGDRDPELPWFEDGEAALDAEGCQLPRPDCLLLAEVMRGLNECEHDPERKMLFRLATIELNVHHRNNAAVPPEILFELRAAAVELAGNSSVPENRLGDAILSVHRWEPSVTSELEL